MSVSKSVTRFDDEMQRSVIHLSRASKFARLQVVNSQSFVEGETVQVRLLYVHERALSYVVAHTLDGSECFTIIGRGGIVDVQLVFGVTSKPLKTRESTIVVSIPKRYAPVTTASFAIYLQCEVLRKIKDTDVLLHRSDVLVKSSWMECTCLHGRSLFNKYTFGGMDDYITNDLAVHMMQQRWAVMFKYLRDTSDYPDLTQKRARAIIRMVLCDEAWSPEDEGPLLIDRDQFCSGVTDGHPLPSLWQVFENIVELVGRFVFLRQLFNDDQLFILAPNDRLSTSRVEMPRMVHVLRVSKSSQFPALMLDMINTYEDDEQLSPSRSRATVCASVEQIVTQGGNPYLAFAQMDHRLSNVDLKARLRPVDERGFRGERASYRTIRCDVVCKDDKANALLGRQSLTLDSSWWTACLQ